MSDYTQALSTQQSQISKIEDWLKLIHTDTDQIKLRKVVQVLHLKLFVD